LISGDVKTIIKNIVDRIIIEWWYFSGIIIINIKLYIIENKIEIEVNKIRWREWIIKNRRDRSWWIFIETKKK
jgi:hypothetical protein